MFYKVIFRSNLHKKVEDCFDFYHVYLLSFEKISQISILNINVKQDNIFYLALNFRSEFESYIHKNTKR